MSRLLTSTEAWVAMGGNARSGPSAMCKFRANGDGPAYVRLGGRIRYRPEDVQVYIERHLVPQTSEVA